MHTKNSYRSMLLAGVFALSAASLAQYDRPDWWGDDDGWTTSQCWTFENANDPLEPEYVLNPFGNPFATNFGNGTTWLPSYLNRNGVWCLRTDGGLGFDIPNRSDTDRVKLWWTQFDIRVEVGIANIVIGAPGTITSDPIHFQDLGDGWFRATWQGQIRPQPSLEQFAIYVDEQDHLAYVDDFYFATRCVVVPEPATMVALGLGAAALIRRRKK